MKSALYYGNYACFNLIFELGLTCATLWYGGHLILVNRMDGANLIPFLLYQLSLGDSLQGMGAVYTGLMQAVGAAEKVFEFIDRQSRMPLDVGTHDPGTEVQGKIEFKNVSFYYPSRPGLCCVLWSWTFCDWLWLVFQIKLFCQIYHLNFPLEKWQRSLAVQAVESRR